MKDINPFSPTNFLIVAKMVTLHIIQSWAPECPNVKKLKGWVSSVWPWTLWSVTIWHCWAWKGYY